MFKGKIVLIPFPFTDLSGSKVRPAIILSNNKKGEDCLVAFISSLGIKRSEFDVSVKLSLKNGLKIDSVVKVDKIATLEKKIILGEIGILESEYVTKIDEKLKKLFSI
ncbi:MAG: type II toxin-antitoxin system PemK/MazF family toxin [Patescibacteria group bacterium]